jgi:hypothetical protein
MQDPRPAVDFYGPDLVMIYNEPYIELLGGLHPCMGISARVALAGVWSTYFEPIIARNLAGETVKQTNFAIHLIRTGFLEEICFYLSSSLSLTLKVPRLDIMNHLLKQYVLHHSKSNFLLSSSIQPFQSRCM